MYKVLKTFVFFLISCSVVAQNNNLHFRHLTVDDGLPHTDATQVLQDKQGFIWISTYSGLTRFDGYEIKNFVSKNYKFQNVYLNRINKLFYDNDKIWLATQGGIAYFDIEKEEIFIPHFEKKVENNFSSVCIYKNQIFGLSNGKLYIFEQYDNLFKPLKIPENLPFINFIQISKEGELFLGTIDGLYSYRKNIYKKYALFTNNTPLKSLSFVGFDSSDNLVLGSNQFLSFVSIKNLKKQDLEVDTYNFNLLPNELEDFKNQNINSVVQDLKGDYWISTPIGLLKFDLKSKEFNIPKQSSSLSTKYTNNLLIDKSGSLWVSTFGGGVNFIDLTPKLFNTLRFEDQNSNYVRAIYEEDNTGNLWIGTRTEGLIYYDFQTKKSQILSTANNLSSNYIRAIIKDKYGLLWVGTENGISILKDNKVIKNLKNNPQSINSLTNNVIYSLAVDVFGQVWAGSWQNGLNKINFKNDQLSIDRFYEADKHISSNKITYVYADPLRPEVFVGTSKGLDHFYLNDDGKIAKVFHYLGHDSIAHGISSNFIWPILRSDVNTLWVGTIGGGLNKITINPDHTYTSQVYDIYNGLPSNDVESLLQDNNGNIWIGGKGLSMLNPKTNQITKYDAKDGLQSNIFKIGSSFKGRDGRLYFGGVNGLNYFYPSQIKPSAYVSPIVFSDILINNTPAKINKDELPKSVNFLEEIVLNHLQNNLIIKFASLDFANSDKCIYRYKLLGFNEDWVVTDSKNRFASFTNLDYGDYVLHLQSTNHDGIWMDKIKKIKITINPPWWKTNLAKAFYILMLGLVVYLIYKYQIDWLKLNQKLEIKEIEKRNQDEMHQLRMQFFTNISHELKTPLSLIIGPIEKLLNENLEKENQYRLYHLVQRNANRLLNLVNELLEFRKAESGIMKLKIKELSLKNFLEDISLEFDELANEKNISFIKNFEPDTKLWIDANVLGKIIVNLLSNAFKYTPENRLIKIEVGDDPYLNFKNIYSVGEIKNDIQYKWIRVYDNGIGIETESLSHIFERFYRVTDAEIDRLPGSGIGLAYVKNLVLIHKGIIKVSSEPNLGTEFLVGLPMGSSLFNNYEIENSKDFSLDDSLIKAIETNDLINEMENNLIDFNTIPSKKLPKLLIVEDNDELRGFLYDSFLGQFTILLAKDGVFGLEIARTELPDMIVSDVMMPIMDGLSMCKAIKSDLEISHIPVILLTAKNSDESKILGGEVGADAYITKPFSLKLLQLTIKNILGNRKKLKEMYANDIYIEAREMGTSKREKEFIDFLISIVEQHLDDVNLDVEMICNQVGMSRTKLYNKIQSLTGQPVGEFIRKLRLKKAAQIIISEDVNIIEVMERVGIQSQSYFTKAFKKEFGKTPTKFLHDYIVDKEINKIK